MLSSPCPICGNACSVAASSCPDCGYSFETKAKQTVNTKVTATISEIRLRPCPDCAHNCSTAAVSCPNCGRPFQRAAQSTESNGRSTTNGRSFSALENVADKSTNTGAIAVMCFLLLGAGLLAYFVFWSGSNSPTSQASNSLSPQAKTATNDALKSLRKVDAATQVGVSYVNYGSLLIEAQAQVNDALRVLPSGELKQEIQAAMEAYTDVRPLWDRIINGQDLIWTEYAETRVVIQKHRLNSNHGINAAMQQIWSAGRGHLARASSLLNQ